jgi:hypothetical protein
LRKKKRASSKRDTQEKTGIAGPLTTGNKKTGKPNDNGDAVQREPDKSTDGGMLRKIIGWLDELTIQRIALGVAAFLLAVTSYQACLTRTALHDSERAFVYMKDPFIVGDGIKDHSSLGRKAFLVIDLPNSADTPARKVVVNTNYCATTSGLPDDFSYPPGTDEPPMMLPPKASGQTSFPVTEDLLLDIENSRKYLFVYGAVSYEDIFDEWHVTEFCSQYRGYVLNTDGTLDKFIFAACKKHNCHDGDCQKYWGAAPCPQ